MANELYILLGASVGAIAAYITTKITTDNHLRIAKINADKDLILQTERLANERLRDEVDLERKKLEELHLILSNMAYENSLTSSYIDSDEELELSKFRIRYRDNCQRLHKAIAIADLYYPSMSDGINEIYGHTNLYWGHQENILRLDMAEENREGRKFHLAEVLKAGNKIDSEVKSLQYKISAIGTDLKNRIEQPVLNN